MGLSQTFNVNIMHGKHRINKIQLCFLQLLLTACRTIRKLSSYGQEIPKFIAEGALPSSRQPANRQCSEYLVHNSPQIDTVLST